MCFFNNRYANPQLLELIVLSDTNKLLQTYISRLKRKYSEMFVFCDITESHRYHIHRWGCMCTMIHSSYRQGHTDFNMSVCVAPDMRFIQWKNWIHTVEAIVKTSARVDGEGITSSLTRTQSWLWTLPLLCVWLIHLQIRTGGITVRDRGKSSDIHKALSRADTLTFILLSMTVLCLSLFHLLLLPIIASSPVTSPCVIHFVPLYSSTGK